MSMEKFIEMFEGIRDVANGRYTATFANNEDGEQCLVIFDFGVMYPALRGKTLFSEAESHWFTINEFEVGSMLVEILAQAVLEVDNGSIGSDHLSPVDMTKEEFIKNVKEGLL